MLGFGLRKQKGGTEMKDIFRINKIAACILLALAFSTTQITLAATPDANTSGAEIKIDNFTFTPQIVTVKVGTKITWTNSDDIPHTVVSSDSSFRSKTLDTDEKFSFTPTKPGSYSYFCSIHPKMTATVVVQ
jgi:plastocyanin